MVAQLISLPVVIRNIIGTNPVDWTTPGAVCFDGPEANGANEGNPIPMYSPPGYSSGSSIAHFDCVDGEHVMCWAVGENDVRRTYSEFDRAILSDIGWTVAAIPEPNSFILIGLIGMATQLYRRTIKFGWLGLSAKA